MVADLHFLSSLLTRFASGIVTPLYQMLDASGGGVTDVLPGPTIVSSVEGWHASRRSSCVLYPYPNQCPRPSPHGPRPPSETIRYTDTVIAMVADKVSDPAHLAEARMPIDLVLSDIVPDIHAPTHLRIAHMSTRTSSSTSRERDARHRDRRDTCEFDERDHRRVHPRLIPRYPSRIILYFLKIIQSRKHVSECAKSDASHFDDRDYDDDDVTIAIIDDDFLLEYISST